MVSVEESEILGRALDVLEALNGLMLQAVWSKRHTKLYWIHYKIRRIVEYMDKVIV